MGVIDFLKKKKKDVLIIKEQESSKVDLIEDMKPKEHESNKTTSIDDIKIVIENSNGFFSDEPEQIKKAAIVFYESGKSETFEDAIIDAGTIIRGLKYDGIKKDENGNSIIVFNDKTIKRSDRMYKDEYVVSPDGIKCQVLDTDSVDFSDALLGRKSKETQVLRAKQGDPVPTINGEGKVESVYIANEGEAIFFNNDKDKYVPRDGNGNAWMFDNVTDYGYEYTSSIYNFQGRETINVKSTSKALVLPEIVDRPTCIKDAWGEGAHQFLSSGATLKQDPKDGKVTGIDKTAFDNTWELLENEIEHKL